MEKEKLLEIVKEWAEQFGEGYEFFSGENDIKGELFLSAEKRE